MADLWDTLSTAWDDINSTLAPVADFLQPIAQDLVPGFKLAQDVFGIQPPTGQSYEQAYYHPLATNPGIATPFTPGQAIQLGGATMNFDLTTTGMRGLIPFQGQGPPAPGYHLARRSARRPQQGRAGGLYWVPRRSMNPLNPRALMRAERRMAGFTKYVKRHFSLTHLMPKRKKPKGRFGRRK